MLYQIIEKSIDKGAITLHDTLSHRALEDELIPSHIWNTSKNKLIKSFNNQLLSRISKLF